MGTKTANKGRGLALLTVISFMAIPFCIIIFMSYTILTDSSFYTGILKKADLLSTFIQTRNRHVDEKIKNDIENELHLESAKYEFEQKRREYESAKSNFDRLNKTEEYEKLKQEYREINTIEWKNVSHLFNEKSESKNYQKSELKRIDLQLEEIKKYRSENKKLITKAKDIFADAEETLDDTRDILEAKEKKARKITESSKGTAGIFWADIELVTPELNEVLNNKLIDENIKTEINEFIHFVTSRDEQIKNGRLSYEVLETGSEIKIMLPEIYLNLMVNDDSLGINRKRHLFSEVFSGIIQNKKGLRYKNDIINIFRLSDTGFAEWFSRWYLKNYGMSLRNARIYLNPIVLSNSAAYKFNKVMEIASMKDMFRIAVPLAAAALLLLMLIYPAPLTKKIRHIRAVLLYPSLFVIALCAAAVYLTYTGTILNLAGELNIYAAAYIRNILNITVIQFITPIAAVFAIMALAGILIGKFVRKKKESV